MFGVKTSCFGARFNGLLLVLAVALGGSLGVSLLVVRSCLKWGRGAEESPEVIFLFIACIRKSERQHSMALGFLVGSQISALPPLLHSVGPHGTQGSRSSPY